MSKQAQQRGLVTIGETMGLLTSTAPGPLSSSRQMWLSHAGSESNVAIGVRRLGQPATWIGRVGSDAVGDLVLRELRAEGINCLAIRDTAPTGLILRQRRTTGLTRVDYHRNGSAGSRLSPADIAVPVLTTAAVLHVTGITPALGVAPRDAIRMAVDVAHDAGVTVSLDVNYRAALWSRTDAGDTLRPLLGKVDIIFASPDEARLLVQGETPRQLAAQLARRGPTQVVLKLGADGAYARIDGAVHEVLAVPVQVADPVGAGDAFVAGYLAELIAGSPPEKRLSTATATGAFAVATAGDWEGLPHYAELTLVRPNDDVLR